MWANEDAYLPQIVAEAQAQDVPPDLAAAIVGTESGFKPTAYRAEPKIGDGSVGLMQILLRTANSVGFSGERGDPALLSGLFDPATNIHFGVSYLRSLLDMVGGNVKDAISAYNGGYAPGNGFGRVVTKPTTVCLARDSTGKCVTAFTAQPGQYGNQPYVDKVTKNLAYFTSKLSGGGGDGGGTAGVALLALMVFGGAALIAARPR